MTITRGNNYKRKEGEEEARGILRKNYNGGKNRYNSGGGLVEGGGQREKMATRGKRLVKERGTSEKRSRGREEWRFAQRQFINHTTTRGRPWRAISSFILINNACQESGRVGASPGHGNNSIRCYTIPTETHYFHLWKLDLILRRDEGEEEGRRKGEREREELKRNPSRRPSGEWSARRPSITDRVIISDRTARQRNGNESSNLQFRRTW